MKHTSTTIVTYQLIAVDLSALQGFQGFNLSTFQVFNLSIDRCQLIGAQQYAEDLADELGDLALHRQDGDARR